MVHLNVANLSTDNAYTAHLFPAAEAEDTDSGMKLFAEAWCGEGGFEQAHLVPASHYPQAMAEEWDEAEGLDNLRDLVAALTFDGHMCKECVDVYREERGRLDEL